MEKYVRRIIIGFLAGLAPSAALTITLSNMGLGIVLGALFGVAYSLAFPPEAVTEACNPYASNQWR